MSGLEGVYDGDGRWLAVVRATLLFAGGLVAAVGFVAATASLVAGFGFGTAASLKVATLLGGALLLVGFLAPFAHPSSAGRSRTLAGVGIAFCVAGLALFWTTLPAGWTGSLARLPPVALGTYATGLLVVVGAGLTGSVDIGQRTSSSGRDATDGIGTIESVVETDADRDTRPSTAVGDGGEEASDLTFFDDET